jgi:ketosteroid isomerase-like protein
MVVDESQAKPLTFEQLAARISRMEDLAAIRDLSYRYALAVDARDYEILLGLFTPEATLGGTSNGAASVQGIDAIISLLKARLDAQGPTYHVTHHVLIDFDESDPDQACGVATAHAETKTEGGSVVRAVRYDDEYRRIRDRWLFHRRTLSFPLL